ncbi:uncharacterized protein I303_108522 [Kwoniella dejecticola CBS 10117]|uniref:Uncharacterized protein n=1 Tax=Kwoniella dejecticola CBS 10117 TaxID=1296121 RepID=A0A1A5ZX57_9TREE|nr:uncharacterized protein I303_07154 [Kwoniella dejecticola CBS 10117]OBR82395.1 hypothetical protein I303_07154 [Kwoniella dejecticola CBS 10117]
MSIHVVSEPSPGGRLVFGSDQADFTKSVEQNLGLPGGQYMMCTAITDDVATFGVTVEDAWVYHRNRQLMQETSLAQITDTNGHNVPFAKWDMVLTAQVQKSQWPTERQTSKRHTHKAKEGNHGDGWGTIDGDAYAVITDWTVDQESGDGCTFANAYQKWSQYHPSHPQANGLNSLMTHRNSYFTSMPSKCSLVVYTYTGYGYEVNRLSACAEVSLVPVDPTRG